MFWIGICLILLWVVLVYNQLVRQRLMLKEAWSGIDVQLKRRSELLPNLVETVKGYSGYEKSVLESVTALRSQVNTLKSDSPDSAAERQILEQSLGQSIGNLMAIAEAYPDLKANEQFLNLQASLVQVEDEIQMARRYYNGSVRDFNTMAESFPPLIIAKLFGFKSQAYFELENWQEGQSVNIRLT